MPLSDLHTLSTSVPRGDAAPPGAGRAAPIPKGAYGKGRPYADGAVDAVRRLIEETTLTYDRIAARTGASPASISRWMPSGRMEAAAVRAALHAQRADPARDRLQQAPLAQPPSAGARRSLRARTGRGAGVDLDKLGQALELAKMAKLAAMSRTRRRTEAVMWGEPMRPIVELCAVGVDLSRAPRAAVEDFVAHRAEPREEDKPPRSRGRGNARYRTRKQRHAWMLERE